jgi:small subunit ribosomal protein S1
MRDMFDDEDEQKKSAADSGDFAQMFEDSMKGVGRKLKVGDKVRGEILTIGKEQCFVSTGTVDDGAVQKTELFDKDGQFNYKVGDFVDLFVTQVRNGQTLLSPKATAKNMAEDLEDAHDMMLPVEGRVTELCNGGFRVLLMGKTAFCPVSQIDTRRVVDQESYLGKKFEFLITQYSERGRNIVVSRRKLLDEQKELSLSAFIEDHKPGDVLSGVVTRLEKFGAFIEIAPGLEGMAHVSELAWSRTENPADVVNIGQEVSVKILKIEEGGGRLQIALSVKQAQPEPWHSMPADIREGAVVGGKVTRCMKFGAFVELAPGIEGLIPMGEMSYSKRVLRSDELFKEGDTVIVMVKEIRLDEHRMVLSLRDAGADPWAMAEERFSPGAVVRGILERREVYGLFIKLDEGVVGLLPKSKATDNPEFSYDKAKVGDQVTVQVDEFRQAERKISLKIPLDPGAAVWQGFSQSAQSKVKSMGTLSEQFGGLFGSAPAPASGSSSGSGKNKKM